MPPDGKPLIYSRGGRPNPLAAGWEALSLPCGNCVGCRIDRSKEWAARIVHESQMHPENCFVTLTYNDENLPHDGSLNERHFQLFMKRLRRKFNDRKIRFFHCGEYGETLGRPHYHACLFNIDFHDKLLHSVSNDIPCYESEQLNQLWGKGFCTVGELNYETAAYTARYIMKKVTGKKAEEHYTKVHPYTGEIHQVKPEYITMSLGRKRGEGIGGSFYQKYKTDFFPRDECPVPGKGVFQGAPRYYLELLREEEPDTYETIKATRGKFHEKVESDHTPQRLEQREKVKEVQLSKLKRS